MSFLDLKSNSDQVDVYSVGNTSAEKEESPFKDKDSLPYSPQTLEITEFYLD
ncbi:MAG: hypothetical protein ACJAXJ_001896 [Colwellia sp.]